MNDDVVRHVSAEEIDRYQRRMLAPADLLAVDDHLARCRFCRGQVLDAGRLNGTVSAIRRELARAVDEIEHPTPERLAALVDGDLDDVEIELLEAHLDVCRHCREDVDDLQEVRRERRRTVGELRPPATRRWPAYAAMATAAAGLAGILAWGALRPDRMASPESRRLAPGAIENPSPHDLPATLLTLHDEGATVTLSEDGTLRGLPPLSGQDVDAIRQALQKGRIDLPPLAAAIAGGQGTLMGGATTEPTFRPVRPMATAVETDRPMFEWTRLPGASAYVVSIVDQDFEKIAESGPLALARWQPASPLARGRIYRWQVRASRGTDEIMAPTPPQPDAMFQVLSQKDADRVAALQSRLDGSHLASGVLLAQAGLLADAEHELEQLVAENPGVAAPRVLLRHLREQREPARRWP